MSATCLVCGGVLADVELLEHLRLIHPDEYGDGPECWPDGSLVVYDETLAASDFGDTS